MSTNFATRKDNREPVTADRTERKRATRRDALRLQKRMGTKSSRDYNAARWSA